METERHSSQLAKGVMLYTVLDVCERGRSWAPVVSAQRLIGMAPLCDPVGVSVSLFENYKAR
jgi:hypothetical protein